jgi:hypothetical protein
MNINNNELSMPISDTSNIDREHLFYYSRHAAVPILKQIVECATFNIPQWIKARLLITGSSSHHFIS